MTLNSPFIEGGVFFSVAVGGSEALEVLEQIGAIDSEIDRVSEYKNLASWGGFRQHYIDQNKNGTQGEDAASAAEGVAAVGSAPGPPAAAHDDEWKRRIQEQLLQKRAEILATQRKLESLSLEQQELEKLYTQSRP